MGGGCPKKKEVKLDVKNNFAGSHTENRWRCSNSGANIKLCVWAGGRGGGRFGLEGKIILPLNEEERMDFFFS
jgi:hypothetical protein